MGKFPRFSLDFVKKRGIRMRISSGSRFAGCSVDSRERRFGRIFVSNEFLAAIIYKHTLKSDVTQANELILAHLRKCHTVVFVVPIDIVSVRSLSRLFTRGINRTCCHRGVYLFAFLTVGGVQVSGEGHSGWSLSSIYDRSRLR